MTTRTPPPDPHYDIAKALHDQTLENRKFRESMYTQMQAAVESLGASVDTLNATTSALHVALVGDSLGNPGIVARQSSLQGQLDEERSLRREADKRIHDKIDRLYKYGYIAVGAAAGAGVGIAEIVKGFLS